MKLYLGKRKRVEYDADDDADDHAGALNAAVEDANDGVQDLSEEVQDAIEDDEDLIYARRALQEVEEEIVEDDQDARKKVLKKSTLTAEQIRLTKKPYSRRRVGVLRTASGCERATGAPFNLEHERQDEAEEGQPYLPSAHPSVSVSAPVVSFRHLQFRIYADKT